MAARPWSVACGRCCGDSALACSAVIIAESKLEWVNCVLPSTSLIQTTCCWLTSQFLSSLLAELSFFGVEYQSHDHNVLALASIKISLSLFGVNRAWKTSNSAMLSISLLSVLRLFNCHSICLLSLLSCEYSSVWAVFHPIPLIAWVDYQWTRCLALVVEYMNRP